VRTDSRGEFAFDHLPPGNYSVEVRADGYLTNSDNRDIDITQTPPLTITMRPGLRIEGQVVDAVTSQPVTFFAAKALRIASLDAGVRNAQRRKVIEQIRALSRREGERTPEEQAQITKLHDTMMDLGNRGGMGRGGRDGGDRGSRGRDGGGMRGMRGRSMRGMRGRNSNIAGDAGKPKKRPDGRFAFDGLEEGVYVVDIGSPDHQRLRSTRVELRSGAVPHVLNLILARGLILSGTVLAKTGNRPLPQAKVELRLVDEQDDSRRRNRSRDPARGGGRNGRTSRFGGEGPRTTRVLDVSSGRDGKFEIKGAPPGKYVLRATAEGFTVATTKAFLLSGDQSGINLLLGAKGILEGRVSGIRPDQIPEARVMVYSLPRNFRDVHVQADGSYRITGLEPGDYFVRASLGEGRRLLFRQMFRGFGRGMGGRGGTGGQSGQNQNPPPVDVKIKEDGVHHFDVVLTINLTGIVVGKVLVDGAAAQGYRVSLRKLDPDTGAQQPGGGFARHDGGGNRATVDQNGDYKIRDVEVGRYVVTVSRGGFGGSTVSRQDVFVGVNTETVVPTVWINIGSLEGVVKIPPPEESKSGSSVKTDPKLAGGGPIRGRVTLYKGVTTVPDQADGNEVLRFTARIRAGKFEFTGLPTGDYLLQVRVSGREATTQTVYIGSGSEKITVTGGKVRQRPGK
jgi:hypothetical protein